MTTPDWSKAPDGATHWAKGPSRWCKLEGTKLYLFHILTSGWEESGRISAGNLDFHSEHFLSIEKMRGIETPQKYSAHSILDAAASHMQDRAATYDKPEGERSMGATVDAFRAVTGHDLTEEQGWLFMALLKAVRSQQGGYRADSYEDGAAYFALAGESSARERAAK